MASLASGATAGTLANTALNLTWLALAARAAIFFSVVMADSFQLKIVKIRYFLIFHLLRYTNICKSNTIHIYQNALQPCRV